MFNNESSFGGAGGWGESPSTPSTQTQRRRGGEALLPITCTELVAKSLPNQEKITVGSKEFTTVSIVGKIMAVQRGGAQIDYKIADNDDDPELVQIFVRHFQENNDEEFIEGSPVRVCGRLRNFDGEQSIIAFKIYQLDDFEKESRVHKLEARYAELFYEKDIIGRIQKGWFQGLEGTGFAPTGTTNQGPPPPGFGGAAGGTQSTAGQTNMTSSQNGGPIIVYQSAGLTGLNAQVHQFVVGRNDLSEEGVSMGEMQASFSNIQMNRLQQAIDFLCSEGHIYSTIDEEHYKAI